jgi:ribosomal protein L11 methyltransferase
MDYTELHFTIESFTTERLEILIATLSQLPFDSFSETDNGCKAYILSNKYNESDVNELCDQLYESLGLISYISQEIEQQNWNETWESNFDPIHIRDKCRIYASFHPLVPGFQYNILIEPKMAFGTGHHATTEMMLEHILKSDIDDKKVLDMGAGTGVLAILASMKGASVVYAVDNDHWAYKNCIENIENNNCENVIAIEGDINSISDKFFDIILANINRNTLISDIPSYINSLNSGGKLIVSGFYVDDIPAIERAANEHDLYLKQYLEKDEWASLVFEEK